MGAALIGRGASALPLQSCRLPNFQPAFDPVRWIIPAPEHRCVPALLASFPFDSKTSPLQTPPQRLLLGGALCLVAQSSFSAPRGVGGWG